MARFDATTAREMLMEFFDDDGSDEEEVLLDLEEVLIDQNGEIIRTEDIVQAPSNRIIEEDEDEGWLCASNPPLVEPFTMYLHLVSQITVVGLFLIIVYLLVQFQTF